MTTDQEKLHSAKKDHGLLQTFNNNKNIGLQGNYRSPNQEINSSQRSNKSSDLRGQIDTDPRTAHGLASTDKDIMALLSKLNPRELDLNNLNQDQLQCLKDLIDGKISQSNRDSHEGTSSRNDQNLINIHPTFQNDMISSSTPTYQPNPMPDKYQAQPESQPILEQKGDVMNDDDIPILSDEDEYYDDKFMDLIDEMDESHNYSNSNLKWSNEFNNISKGIYSSN